MMSIKQAAMARLGYVVVRHVMEVDGEITTPTGVEYNPEEAEYHLLRDEEEAARREAAIEQKMEDMKRSGGVKAWLEEWAKFNEETKSHPEEEYTFYFENEYVFLVKEKK
jgi:hypothetical protein